MRSTVFDSTSFRSSLLSPILYSLVFKVDNDLLRSSLVFTTKNCGDLTNTETRHFLIFQFITGDCKIFPFRNIFMTLWNDKQDHIERINCIPYLTIFGTIGCIFTSCAASLFNMKGFPPRYLIWIRIPPGVILSYFSCCPSSSSGD